MTRKLLTRTAVSIAISACLVWWLMSQGFHVVPSWDAIVSHLALWGVWAYLGLFLVYHTLRAWRWNFLIKPLARVKTSIMMNVAFAGFAAIQMMPLRTGEVARPYLLDRYTGVSKSALFGTIAIERVVDGLVVSACLSAMLFTIPASAGPLVWSLRLLPLGVFLVALALLLAFYRNPRAVGGLVGRVLGVFHGRLGQFTVGVLERFHGGLAALPNRRAFWGFVAATVGYWAVNGVGFFLLASACGVPLSMAGAAAGMGILAVGILLPAGPGYFGNFQIAVLAALAMYVPRYVGTDEASVFIFVLYVLQTGFTLLFGIGAGVSLLSTRRHHHQKTGD